MPDNTSTTKLKMDISELKKSMTEARRQIRLANSEFKASTAGMDKWSESADGLTAKMNQLRSTLKAEKSILADLQKQYDLVVAEQGKSSKGAQELEIKINNQKAAIEKTRSSLERYGRSLSDLQKESKQTADSTNTIVSAYDKLSDTISDQEQKLQELKSKYQDLVLEQKGSSDEAKDLASQIGKLSTELSKNKSDLSSAASAADKLDNSLEDAGDSAKDSADGFTIMKGAIADLVADAVKSGIDALKDLATEADAAYKSFQAQTGASTGEMKEFKSEMDNLYKNAYGESLGDIGDKMAYIKQVTGETDPSKIKELTENAITLEDTFGSDFNETIRGVNNLMQHFGIDAETAFDLFAKGSQVGLDYTGELGDNVAEYGGNFQQAGYSADEYFQLLANGTKNGAYNLDKVNDSINEAKNRLGDGTIGKNIDIFSDGTKKAFKAWESGKGTMKDVIDSIVGDINNCTDEQDALNMAAVAFGTMGEDANLQVVKSLTTVGDTFGDVKGTMESVKDVKYSDVGTQFTELGRTLKQELIFPLLQELLPGLQNMSKFAIDNMNAIIPVATVLGTTIAGIFTVNKIATFVQSLATLKGSFDALTKSTVAAEGATKLLAIAQMALPYVAVAAGIAALAGGILYLNEKNQEAIEKECGLSEAQKKTVESAKSLNDEYSKLAQSRTESFSSISTEYGYLSQLKDEYNGLIDSNGKVKKGYEDRANFIVNQLAQSLGVEVSEIQKVIDKNGELGGSIDALIQKKKAEAILNANEQAYTEAIQNKDNALKTYQANLEVLNTSEEKYKSTKEAAARVWEKYNELSKTNAIVAEDYLKSQSKVIDGNEQAKKSYEEAKKGVEQSEAAYVGYNATIQNYEGLSSAVISGDTKKINSSLRNMENNFITAETGTKASLERQVKNMQDNYTSLKSAIDSNTPGVTKKQVKQAKQMVDAAEKELAKLTPKAKSKGKQSGDAHASGVESTKSKNKKAGQNAGKSSVDGAEKGSSGMKKKGENAGKDFGSGIDSKKKDAKTKGKNLAEKGKEGAESVKTKKSGEYFGQGYIDGINSKKDGVWTAAWNLAKKAWNALKSAQEEGSPSKLTYQSGVFFTQGYINGISGMQKNLVSTVQNMVGSVVKEMTKLSNYNFSEVASNASTLFSNAMTEKTSYMLNKMSYQNEQKLAWFDDQISKLESAKTSETNAVQKASDATVKKLQKYSDAKVKDLEARLKKTKDSKKKKLIQKEIKAEKASVKKQIAAQESNTKKQIAEIEKNYNKLISEQNKFKEAYQSASSEMISEFTDAMNTYQTKAQELINDTINGISDTYQEKYNSLISKQDTLISKLKSAGDLFEISGAGIMTINDIKTQTENIKEYTAKLQKIKGKVSADLFDQIASYDMDQGGAFMDRLLALSNADLKAYSDAYDEKMRVAEELSKDTYKSDFDNVANEYQKALKNAFSQLPDELAELGKEVMSGFVSGLTTNTDYLDSAVQTIISGMIGQFKEQLDIHSPSKVLEKIGDYTGLGFVNGLKNTVNRLKSIVGDIADSVSLPLAGVKSSINGAKSSISGNGAQMRNVQNSTSVVNNYNLVQNNSSPKALSALETYRARRQQVSMVKAMTQSV